MSIPHRLLLIWRALRAARRDPALAAEPDLALGAGAFAAVSRDFHASLQSYPAGG